MEQSTINVSTSTVCQMPHTFQFDMATFSPAEAERIAGPSTTLQRDWRRRGFLPSNKGHARFDVFDIAKLMVLHSMSARGIGPVDAAPYADWAMNGIALAALGEAGAVDGDEYPGPPDMLAQSIVAQRSPMGEALSRVMTVGVLVVFADGTERFDFSADRALDWASKNDPEKKLVGPVIVLDLSSMGTVLAHRAARSLATATRIETEGRN